MIGRGKSGQVATIEEAILDRWHAGRLADALLLDSKDTVVGWLVFVLQFLWAFLVFF